MKTLRVLLVEDEMVVAMDIEERISRMGYEPAGRALSGQQAIELTAKLRPDVVVMDIRLQGEMDGITAAGEINHQFAAPVIFLTAHSEDETLARAKLVSPYSYLIKPIKDSDLKSAIEIAFHKYGADREINRLNRLLNVLSQVNKTVLHCHTREQLFADACRLLVERGQIDLAWIGWRDPATARLTPVASYSRVAQTREFLHAADFWADDRSERQGNPGRAAREGRPFFCNECGKGECPYSSERKPARFGFQSCGSFPLRFQGEVVGVISLCEAMPGFFQQAEIGLMEEVALSVSFALDKIEAEAERDQAEEELRSANAKLIQTAAQREVAMEDLGQHREKLAEEVRERGAALVISQRQAAELQQRTSELESQRRRLAEVHAGTLSLMEDVVAASDLTESANRALRESEQRMRSLLASMSDLVFVLDAELVFREYHQPAATKLFTPPEHFIGRRVDEIGFPEPARGLILQALKQTLQTGEPSQVEYLLEMGDWRAWFDLHVTTLVDHAGLRTGLTCVARDISAQRQREAVTATRARLMELANHETTDVVLRTTLDEAEALTGSSIGFFHFLEQDQITLSLQTWSTNTLRHMCKAEGAGRHYPVDQAGVWVDCIHERRPVIHNDYVALPHRKGLPPGHAEVVRMLVVPVLRADKIVALLGVGNKGSNYVETDSEMLSMLADLAWDIAERHSLQGELQEFNATLEQRVLDRTAELSREIAERRQAEAALRTKNLVFDASLAATSIADIAGVIIEVNDAFLRIWGYRSKTEVLGRPVAEFLETQDEATAIVDALNRIGQWEGEYRAKKADGSIFHAHGQATTMREPNGNLIGYQSAVIDVSARKQTEVALLESNRQLHVASTIASEMAVKAQAATVAKSRFLANMSHEIRTPLNAIIGFAQLLRNDTDISSLQKHRVETIGRSGEHLLQLLNDILDLSKIEAGAQNLTPTTFDLRVLLGDLIMSFRQRAETKSLALETEGIDLVPQDVIADESKLRQILMNLLGNAVKFTAKGGVRLRAHAEPEDTEGRWRLKVWVEDTGVGILPEELPLLFQAFEQTASGRHRNQGTGLGLAISRQLARLMGGDVSVSSTAGQGSAFCLELPIKAGAATLSSGRIRSDQMLRAEAGQHRCRVLVVDDTATSRRLLVEILNGAGFEVFEAESGIQAVAVFPSVAPHLVLMDFRMPGMDGDEAIRRIRATAEGARVKIMMVTASVTEEIRQQSLEAGADDFLAKPFRQADLLERIRLLTGVSYLPAEAEPSTTESILAGRSNALTKERLAVLPDELKKQLVAAAIRGRHDHLLKLSRQVADIDLPMSEALRELVAKFDYETLLQLLA
jgi:PAS domain S-box-containing protein